MFSMDEEQIHHKPIKILTRISNFLYDHFKTIIIWLIVLALVNYLFFSSFPLIRVGALLFTGLAFLVMVVNFLIKKGLKSIYNLIRNDRLTIEEIIGDYVLAAIAAIVFFTLLYSVTESLGLGRLQYGGCNDDSLLVEGTDYNYVSPFSRVYFSAITFFTVGFGDICPLGADKVVSILNALAGSIINIIVISVAIGQYLNSGRKSKRVEAEKMIQEAEAAKHEEHPVSGTEKE